METTMTMPPTVTLYVLMVHRKYPHQQPAEQVLVAITGDDLDKIRRPKLDEKEEEKKVIEFNESSRIITVDGSVDYWCFSSACVGSSIFLVGGQIYTHADPCAETTNEKLLSIAVEQCGGAKLTSLSSTNPYCEPPVAAVTDSGDQGRVYVFGGKLGCLNRWVEYYDIKENKWCGMRVPHSIARYLPVDCVFWDQKKILIVLVLEIMKGRTDRDFHPTGAALLKCYDLINCKWSSFSIAKGLRVTLYNNRGDRYFLVAAGDFLIQVQGLEWYVYDLHKRTCRGQVEGLEEPIRKLPGIVYSKRRQGPLRFPKDVVYLRGGKKEDGIIKIELCMLWQGLQCDDWNLYFAVVVVEEYDGMMTKKLKATFSSTGRVPLDFIYQYEKCHAM